MDTPILSIIIPTYNRHHLLERAVNSALAQTVENIEVIVVDDASSDPVNLPEYPRLKVIHLNTNRGVSAARNIGAKAANGQWITYLDDDDELLPHMAHVSLKGLAETTLPKPVALLSGIDVIDEAGQFCKNRLPPTLPRGSHYMLEELEPGKSFLCKQTMVVEREVLLSIGGFDESFPSRVSTELFLRLNLVCSILGLPIVTYRLCAHGGSRISQKSSLRQSSFERLVNKHRALFEAHPKQFSQFVFEHAIKLYELDQKGATFSNMLWAIRLAPRYMFPRVASLLKQRLLRNES